MSSLYSECLVVLIFISTFALPMPALILLRRFENPYRLRMARFLTKLGWGAAVGALMANAFPIIIILVTLIGETEQLTVMNYWHSLALIWLFVFVLSTAVFTLRLSIIQFQNERYNRWLHKVLPTSKIKSSFIRKLMDLLSFFDKDNARFHDEGFPDLDEMNKAEPK